MPTASQKERCIMDVLQVQWRIGLPQMRDPAGSSSFYDHRPLMAMGKNASRIPDSVAALFHVVPEKLAFSADCLPMAGRLPPTVYALFCCLDEILPWPAFSTDFLSQQATGELSINGV